MYIAHFLLNISHLCIDEAVMSQLEGFLPWQHLHCLLSLAGLVGRRRFCQEKKTVQTDRLMLI